MIELIKLLLIFRKMKPADISALVINRLAEEGFLQLHQLEHQSFEGHISHDVEEPDEEHVEHCEISGALDTLLVQLLVAVRCPTDVGLVFWCELVKVVCQVCQVGTFASHRKPIILGRLDPIRQVLVVAVGPDAEEDRRADDCQLHLEGQVPAVTLQVNRLILLKRVAFDYDGLDAAVEPRDALAAALGVNEVLVGDPLRLHGWFNALAALVERLDANGFW